MGQKFPPHPPQTGGAGQKYFLRLRVLYKTRPLL